MASWGEKLRPVAVWWLRLCPVFCLLTHALAADRSAPLKGTESDATRALVSSNSLAQPHLADELTADSRGPGARAVDSSPPLIHSSVSVAQMESSGRLAASEWWLWGDLGAVLLVLLSWVGLLHRRVRQQARQLHAEIDQHKRVAAALSCSQTRLQLQLDHMPTACITWSGDHKVTSWNPAAERIFGYTAAEALGRSPGDFLVPPEARELVNGIGQRLLEGQAVSRVNQDQTKDGRPHPLRLDQHAPARAGWQRYWRALHG